MAPPRTSASQGARPAPWLWVALGVVCLGAILGLVWLGGLDEPPQQEEPSVRETPVRLDPPTEAAAEVQAPAIALEVPTPSEFPTRRADGAQPIPTPADPSKVVLDLRWTQGSHVEPKQRSTRRLPRGVLVVDGDSFRFVALRRSAGGGLEPPKSPQLVVEVVGGPDAGRLVRGAAPALKLEHLHSALALIEVRDARGQVLSRRSVEIGDSRPTVIEAREPKGTGRLGGPLLRVEDADGEPFDFPTMAGFTVHGDGRRGDWRVSGSYLPEDLESVFLLEVRGEGIARRTSTETVSSDGIVGRVRLDPAAELEVVLHASDHKGQPATVWVQNAGEALQPGAHRTQLATSVGDTPTVFEELSAGDVWVLAIAQRPYPAVGLVRHTLVAGVRDTVHVSLTPTRAIEGIVHTRGVPASGVDVELWCSRPLQVSAAYLGRPREAYDEEILPLYPPAYQRVTTDREGRFVLADWPELDDEHWLEVLRPEREEEAAEAELTPLLAALGYTPTSSPALSRVLYALRVPENRRVFDIDLAGPPPNVPKGALRLRLHGADSNAKVHVRCDGQSESEHELEGDTLLLGPLARGTWTATVTVGGVVWLEPTEINLQGVFDLEVAAPGGAGG